MLVIKHVLQVFFLTKKSRDHGESLLTGAVHLFRDFKLKNSKS